MVDIKGVFKTYNKKVVIEDVSLTIPKGKITSFIGPNGAGKSTLISMVSRLIAKDEGMIMIDGKDISKSKDSELVRKISILKQSNAMNVKLTVRELICIRRITYRQDKLKKNDWKKVDEAIDYNEIR